MTICYPRVAFPLKQDCVYFQESLAEEWFLIKKEKSL